MLGRPTPAILFERLAISSCSEGISVLNSTSIVVLPGYNICLPYIFLLHIICPSYSFPPERSVSADWNSRVFLPVSKNEVSKLSSQALPRTMTSDTGPWDTTGVKGPPTASTAGGYELWPLGCGLTSLGLSFLTCKTRGVGLHGSQQTWMCI